MILIDTSAWIEFFRRAGSRASPASLAGAPQADFKSVFLGIPAQQFTNNERCWAKREMP